MDVLGVLAVLGAALFVLGAPGLPAVLALRLHPLTAAASIAPISLVLIAITAELGSRLDVPWTILSPLVPGLLLGAALWPLGRRRRGASRSTPHSSTSHSSTLPSSTVPRTDPLRTIGLRGTLRRRTDPPGLRRGPAHLRIHGAGAAGAVGPREPADPSAPATSAERFLASPRGRLTAILIGLVIGGGVITQRALTMMGGIGAVSQTYDNVFHLNAVRHILRAGDGSAWVVGGMTTMPGKATYYPSLWHQAVSLVVQLSGQEIILASNIVMLLVAAVVWPLGLMTLVRSCTSAGPLGWTVAGVLAGVTGAFPLSLMAWGLLLPYLLSLTMIPMVVVLVAQLAGMTGTAADGSRPREVLSIPQLAVLVPAVGGAVALAHPQGVFVGIVLGLPILVWATLVRGGELLMRRPRAGRRFVAVAVMTVVGAKVSSWAWDAFRPVRGSAVWKPYATQQEALGQAVTLAPNEAPSWVPLGVVMFVCLLAALIGSRSRWLLGPWLAAVAMSVITRSEPMGDLRYQLTGNWYSDNFRITAMIAVAAIPVLAVGVEVILRGATRMLPVLRGAGGPALGLVAALAVLALSLASPSSRVNEHSMEYHWRSDELLTQDERDLLERLPEVVPEDAVIATNAWNGSSLAYAISDRPVLNTYMSFQAEPEVHLLNGRLDEAQTNPEVCDAAEDLHVEYALDFGPRELHGKRATYTGLNEISETGAAEVVLQEGDAKLLRMLPCRGTDGSMNG